MKGKTGRYNFSFYMCPCKDCIKRCVEPNCHNYCVEYKQYKEYTQSYNRVLKENRKRRRNKNDKF